MKKELNAEIYRVCFDFKTASEALDFFERYKEMTLQPDGDDLRDCILVHRDALHDRKKTATFLIRRDIGGAGNGRPVTHTEVPRSERISINRP